MERDVRPSLEPPKALNASPNVTSAMPIHSSLDTRFWRMKREKSADQQITLEYTTMTGR